MKKLFFHFLSYWIGYDCGDSFPFDFVPNGILFGSKTKGKLLLRSYPIQCERKWKYSFLSVTYTLFHNGHLDTIPVYLYWIGFGFELASFVWFVRMTLFRRYNNILVYLYWIGLEPASFACKLFCSEHYYRQFSVTFIFHVNIYILCLYSP